VESDVGYVQRNFFSPLPKVKDYEELNQLLLERCKQDVNRHIRGQEAPDFRALDVRGEITDSKARITRLGETPTGESPILQSGSL